MLRVFFSSSKTHRRHTRSNSSSSEACFIFIATLRVSRFWMHVADPQSDPSRSQSRGTLDVIHIQLSMLTKGKRKSPLNFHKDEWDIWMISRYNESTGVLNRSFFFLCIFCFFLGVIFFAFAFSFASAFSAFAFAAFAASAAFCRSNVFLFLSFIYLLACASIS